jgi:peroxiredoxin
MKTLFWILKEGDFKNLQKYKVPLSSDERAKVMKSKSVWHHGPHGEETAGIWKSDNKRGKVRFVCNTHRTYQSKETLAQAIKAFKFVKTTA